MTNEAGFAGHLLATSEVETEARSGTLSRDSLPALIRDLEIDLERVQQDGRPLPWVVHSGCSYRRIASEPTAANGYRSFQDGNVLSATTHRCDGHPDLTMGEGQLNALVRIINSIPAVIAALARARGEQA